MQTFYFFLASAAALVITQSSASYMPCTFGVQKRRNWRDLSASNKLEFLSRIKELLKRPKEGGGLSEYDKLVEVYYDHGSRNIGLPLMLPWQRFHLFAMERVLQSSGKPIFLPYWDWNIDSQAPEFASVWGSEETTFGPINERGCVNSGPFAGYQMIYPQKGCLYRHWNDLAFLSREGLDKVIQRSKNFDQLRFNLETAAGRVHNSLGGVMSTQYSPNDPIHYLVRANVDRQWSLWQYRKPDLAKIFSGNHYGLFPYGAIARDVFDTRNLCYYYNHVDPSVENSSKDFPQISQRVRSIQEDTPGSNLPNASDRSDLFDIRVVEPIPSAWIDKNYLNTTVIRRCEAQMQGDVEEFNSQEEFSKSALWNDEVLLTRVLQFNKQQGRDFTMKLGNSAIEIYIRYPVELDHFRSRVADRIF